MKQNSYPYLEPILVFPSRFLLSRNQPKALFASEFYYMFNIKGLVGSMGWGRGELNSLRDACRKSFHETSLCGLNTESYDVQLLISVVKFRRHKPTYYHYLLR